MISRGIVSNPNKIPSRMELLYHSEMRRRKAGFTLTNMGSHIRPRRCQAGSQCSKKLLNHQKVPTNTLRFLISSATAHGHLLFDIANVYIHTTASRCWDKLHIRANACL